MVPGKAIFEDKDKEDELRKEEEYLMRRTGTAPNLNKASSKHHKLPSSSLTGAPPFCNLDFLTESPLIFI